MTDKSAWSGASGSQVLQHGHKAHATRANELVGNIEGDVWRVSDGLRTILGEAKADSKKSPQLKRFIGSVEKLLKQLNEHVSPELLQELRDCVTALLCKLVELEKDVEKLKKDNTKHFAHIGQLQKDVNELQEENQKMKGDRNKVFLGEVAYTCDRAACAYVYGPNFEFRTLKELARNYESNYGMSPEEAQRYKEFCTFIQRKGLSIDKLRVALLPLRGVRREPAHGRPEELENITAQQLLQWARECSVPQQNVQDALNVLQLFTQPGKPLVLRQDVSKVVQ